MLKFNAFLCLSVFLFSCNQPLSNKSIDKETEIAAIHSVMELQASAWNNAHIEGYMRGYWESDSLVFTGGKSKTTGWRQAVERYKKSYPTSNEMGALDFSDLETTLMSVSTAYTTGAWQVRTDSNIANGRFTLVWRKIKDNWRIVADHSS